MAPIGERAAKEKLLIAGLPALVERSSDVELQVAFAEHLMQTAMQATELRAQDHRHVYIEAVN